MRSNNGWYSVFDTEHRPESGEEVLCLGMLDGALRDEDPLANQNNRVYFIATWYNKGDPILDEEPDYPLADPQPERGLSFAFEIIFEAQHTITSQF